jgi:hypothetical protein
MAKTIKFLWDQMYEKSYIRAFKEKRETVVQVWLNKTSPDGDPDGDWAFPSILGLDIAINQAIENSKK